MNGVYMTNLQTQKKTKMKKQVTGKSKWGLFPSMNLPSFITGHGWVSPSPLAPSPSRGDRWSIPMQVLLSKGWPWRNCRGNQGRKTPMRTYQTSNRDTDQPNQTCPSTYTNAARPSKHIHRIKSPRARKRPQHLVEHHPKSIGSKVNSEAQSMSPQKHSKKSPWNIKQRKIIYICIYTYT